MSDLSQSGPISTVPASSSVEARTVEPHGALSADHVAGGGFGAIAGAVVLGVCNHVGLHISDVDALMIGSAVVSAGAGFGHIIGHVGLVPAVRRALFGSRA